MQKYFYSVAYFRTHIEKFNFVEKKLWNFIWKEENVTIEMIDN